MQILASETTIDRIARAIRLRPDPTRRNPEENGSGTPQRRSVASVRAMDGAGLLRG